MTTILTRSSGPRVSVLLSINETSHQNAEGSRGKLKFCMVVLWPGVPQVYPNHSPLLRVNCLWVPYDRNPPNPNLVACLAQVGLCLKKLLIASKVKVRTLLEVLAYIRVGSFCRAGSKAFRCQSSTPLRLHASS